MKRSACTMKEVFSRGLACLLAAVMLLSASGVPGALAESEGLLPESETPVVSEVTESSTDSLQTEGTPEGELSSETAEEVEAAEAVGAAEAAESGKTHDINEYIYLNGTNWMSGIRDDRYLHEINIPGTHDSGCSEVWNYTPEFSTVESMAITQDLTIQEQLNAGIRLFDLRFTNRIHSKMKNPRLEDLYNCHGSVKDIKVTDADLQYYCTENGYLRTLNNIMDDIEQFLRAHPTETVILNIQSEYEDRTGLYWEIVKKEDRELLKDAILNHSPESLPDYLIEYVDYMGIRHLIFDELSREEATAYVSFWFMKDENTDYLYYNHYSVTCLAKRSLEQYDDILYKGTTVPTLGEVRGKAVLIGDIVGKTGFGLQVPWSNGIGTFTSGGVEFAYQNHYNLNADDKLIEVVNFLTKYDTELPFPGNHTNRGYINFTSGSKVPFGDDPAKVAGKVNPYLYGPNGRLLEDSARGHHYGWVFSDFVDTTTAHLLYHTNFMFPIQGCNITYKNGGEVIETKEVVAGVAVELPVLASDQSPSSGAGFAGWKDAKTGTVYKPGEMVTFEQDTILEAEWGMTWQSLKDAIEGDAVGAHTKIILDADVMATDEDSEIFIVRSENLEPAEVTIDLNGHTLDADSHGGDTDRRIFRVTPGSILHITDSSGSGTGMLTGGCDERGGAILVWDEGTLDLENVTVSGNHASKKGGAVYAWPEAAVSLKNTVITGNTAAEAGAGVFYGHEGDLKMEGNVQIHGNTLVGTSNPLLEGAESNLYLDNTLQNDSSVGFFTVSASLDPESEIGVSIARGPARDEEQAITIGLNGNGSVNSVRSDLNKYEILNRNGEVVFLGRALTVDYDPNGAVSGTVPMDPNSYDDGDTATVLGNTGNLLRPGGGFIGWNTKPDGSGLDYHAGDTITVNAPVTLYARWAAASVTTQENVTTIYAELNDAVDAWVNGSTLTLLGDVTTDEIIYIPQDRLTLDLNGFGITRVKDGTILFVSDGKELTLKDSAPDRTGTGENRPEGVTGGYLTGGYAHGSGSAGRGGAVYVQGTLNMRGGTIIGNQSVYDGGGVYITGTFRMSGGAITGNLSHFGDGGVFVHSGATIEVSGSARIENNNRETGPIDKTIRQTSNVYLKNGSTITVGKLTSGAAFGVTMEEPGVFTTGAAFADDAEVEEFFTSDSDAYTVQRSDDSQGTLLKKPAVIYTDHTADGTTATAVTGRCEGYTVLTAGAHYEDITLTDGWAIVMGSVTADRRITVSGTVNLILCDGATLTALEGITVNAGDTLNIFPGSTGDSVEGTGKLTAKGYWTPGIGAGGRTGDGGTVSVHGGNITASGGSLAAGIGGGQYGNGGAVTIYDGMVTVISGLYSAGIGGGEHGDGGTVAVYGGVVETITLKDRESFGFGIGRGHKGSSQGTLILGQGMYLYGGDAENPETDIIRNHIGLEDGDYVRTRCMTVNSLLPHSHSLVYSVSEDGASLLAQCETAGCRLHDKPATLTLVAPDAEALQYDGTAKSVSLAVDGQTTLWDDVVYTCQKRNPDAEAWEDLPRTTIPAESEEEDISFSSDPTDAGTYRFSASLTAEGTAPVEAAVEYTIAQRPLTVTAVDQTVLSIDQISEAYSRIRTGDGELADGHEIFGFYLTPSPNTAGVTEGDIIPSNLVIYAGSTDVTANYAITYVNGKFYVRENTASVTAAPAAKDDLVYDGEPLELVTAGTADGGTMQYALGTDETTEPIDGWDAAIPTGIDAGTYYIWYRAVGDNAHTDTEPAGPVAVTIGPRIAELAWSDTAFTFNKDAQAPTATVSNLADGHSEADICLVTVEGAQVMPGTYTATATVLSNANYALPTENTAEFTIAKYPARIYFAGSPLRVQLGDEPFNAMLIQTWPGEVHYASENPDIATVDAETGMVTLVGSGEAVITATVEDSDICSYAVKTVSCTVIVSPRTETIRYAKSYVSRLYGSEPFVNPLTNSGDGTVRYSSDNPEIATVDETTGMVTVVSAGEVVIMAEVTDEGTSTYSRTTAGYKLEVRKIDNPGFAAGSATVKRGGNTVSLADYVRDAEGNLSWSIRGEGLGCTVADDGTFTSGNETGSVKVMVTMSGNKNYLQKSVILTVDVVEKTTRTHGGGAGQTVTYGQALYLTGYVPEGVTPDIHYTGVLRSGVAYDSEETPTEAGTYIATISYEDDEDIWVDRFSASIQPRQLGVPEITLGGTLTYNGSEQTQKVAAVIWDETAVPASEYTVTGNTGTDAGTYTLTVTAKPTGNYTGSVTKDFTISKADPDYTVPEGLTANCGQTLAEIALPAGWTWADSSLNVGEAGVHSFKAGFTSAETENYNALTVENIDVTVTVTASAEFSQAPVARENLVFNETLQDLITAGTAVGGTVQYALSTDSPTAFTKNWSEEIPTGTEAGTYYVWYRIVGDESHQDLGPVGPVEVTIAKAEADISYAKTAFEMAYGDAAFTNPLTNTGDGAVSYSSSDSSVATVSDSGLVTIRGLGETTITATATDGTNYSYAVKTVGYTLTVGMSDAVLQLPAFLTQIGEEAFAGTGAVIVEVPENVNAIEARAFADCENLRLIIIPKNVRHVDDTALENCENVTVYGATGSATQRFARMNGFTFVDPDLS